jgi:SAM-dependent methyltransferase
MWSKDVDNVMELADLRPGEKFCDLGCGEGKVVVAAANQGAKAVGYEISILLYVIAKIRSWFSKGKVEIKFRDFWLVDLSDMDVVFFFLIPRIFPKMKEKLERELKPGSRVITYVWPMKGWKEERIIKRAKGPAIYLYNIK